MTEKNSLKNIRNFSIIAHIDHGKSTLSDRMLDKTKTVESRKMHDQVLDTMELEQERGITIKMQPVRMIYEYHPDRGSSQKETQKDAEDDTEENNKQNSQSVYEYHSRGKNAEETQKDAEVTAGEKSPDLLYKDLTYKIRGAIFEVRKKIGLGHKELVYEEALKIEFQKLGIEFENQKEINILYDGKKIGTYRPDFIIEDKIILELKALPEIAKPQQEQIWIYLKGSNFKLGLLVNFGTKDLDIKRIVYDKARKNKTEQISSVAVSASSASFPRDSAGVSIKSHLDSDTENNQQKKEKAGNTQKYIFNLIDTPGHIDFYYEVSRAMKAVEGAVLLVDATQGVQAQTLTTLDMAREAGLKIIPALSKCDSPIARVEEVKEEIAILLDVEMDEIIETSGKTGAGVEELFEKIIQEIPAPEERAEEKLNALIFDFAYHENKGIIVYVRVFSGEVKKNQELLFKVANEKFKSNEVGIFTPFEKEVDKLSAGEIGYIVTGIKKPGIASVGDVITTFRNAIGDEAISEYEKPKPVVWASIYPESQDDFDALRQALLRLKLSDSSFSFEEETSGSLGRGYRVGFLGMLHLEIITERLRREHSLELIITQPTITYQVKLKNGDEKVIYNPSLFPEHGDIAEVREPWIKAKIITPGEYAGVISQIFYRHEGQVLSNIDFGDGRVEIVAEMPLRELMRGFFDELKSETSGYASLSYEPDNYRVADVARMDILVAEELQPAFARVVSKFRMQEEAEKMVEKLHSILPRQNFVMKVQAKFMGRILSSKTVKAYRKDVTGKLYGGDITRKMKLLEKQKKGKKKMKGMGKVNISQDVFLKMMKND